VAIQVDESNPRLSGFSAYYAREIAGHLDDFESARRAAIKRALPIAVLGVIGAGVTGGVFATGTGLVQLPFFGPEKTDLTWIPLVITIGLFAWAWSVVSKAKQKLKIFLAEKVCGFFDLAYTHDAVGFPLDWFSDVSLVPAYDRSTVEDQITGRHDQVSISLADANLKKRVRSGKRTTYRVVFQGLLCAFSFPKRFNGRTVITGDKGKILNWFEGMAVPGGRVHLEDPRFENAFEVYSNDQVEARYLLTPSFMERVLALAEKYRARRLRLAFDAERLLISLDIRTDSFEAGSVFESAADPKRVTSLVEDISLIYDLIDTLGLTLKTRA
jgi:hypothetical protein